MILPAEFDMTITRAEFARLLPAAVGRDRVTESEGVFSCGEAGHLNPRGWRIHLAPLPALRLGSVELERHRVRFEFDGYSTGETAAFMARFELYFRRGGG